MQMSDLDYSIMATARRVAVKSLEHPVSTGQLVAAYMTLRQFGWLGDQIDPDTNYATRPTDYTNAELAIVIAELDGRRGGPYYTTEEWAAIKRDAREMKSQGDSLQQAAKDDSGPAWPTEDMAAWKATRAADEKRALEINALYEREAQAREARSGGGAGPQGIGPRKRPQGGGDPAVQVPPSRPNAEERRTGGTQERAARSSYAPVP